MSKSICLLFILGIFIIATYVPSSFAANQDIIISKGSGANANACTDALPCFNPNEASVTAGATVTWTNSDTVSHTITSGKVSDDNPGSAFDSGLIKMGQTFQFTFEDIGTFDYFCQVHPWMTGQVIVSTPQSVNNPSNTSPTLPGAPTGLSAKIMSPLKILLTWNPPANDGGSPIISYTIEVFMDGGWAKLDTVDNNVISNEITDATPDTKYTFRVIATNAQGSTPSDVVQTTTPHSGNSDSLTPPGPPIGLKAGAVSPYEIILTWNPPANNGGTPITSYNIERQSEGKWWTAQTVGGSITSLSIPGLTPDTLYVLRVSAVNAQGSTPSDVVQITTPIPDDSGGSIIILILLALIIGVAIMAVILIKRRKSRGLAGFKAGQPKIKE